MSLPAFSTQGSLFSTASLSTSLFPETDRYRLFARLIYPRLVAVRSQLEHCYCADNGRVALEPVMLLGVCLLQYLEGQPDRQAVDMLHYHAGWNFALNRQLGEDLFHPTSLVNFRARLLENKLDALGFQTILDGLVEAGLVSRQSRQRLDATQMLGRVSRMNRVDCVRESLRLALRELERQVPADSRPALWPGWWDRYVGSQVDYQADSPTLRRKLIEAGTDAQQVLSWLQKQAEPVLCQGEKVQLLGRVFGEQFEVSSGQAAPEPRTELDSERVCNPHDPQATYASKGQGAAKKEHVGYKVQVAETVCEVVLEEGEPTRNFVVGILAHPARESDETGAQGMEAQQASLGLEKPPVQYVDGAYVSAQALALAQAEGRELIGPAQGAPHKAGQLNVEAFKIDVEQRQAICPAGKLNTQCSRLEKARGVLYRFEFGSHCQDCPLRTQCVGAGQPYRTIEVGEHHTHLQTRRQEQTTEAFAQRIKHRNAIEGTQSELVRAHGLRRARSRGLAQAQLQSYLAGAACNIKRWIRRQIWTLAQAGRPVLA